MSVSRGTQLRRRASSSPEPIQMCLSQAPVGGQGWNERVWMEESKVRALHTSKKKKILPPWSDDVSWLQAAGGDLAAGKTNRVGWAEGRR